MSYDDAEWKNQMDNLPIDFESKNIHKRSKSEFQCRVCFNMFSEKIELMQHIESHTEQFALDFIKKEQPVSGNIIFKKFKNLDLLGLEKRGLIKFSDKSMGWCLPEDVIKYEKMIKSELKFNSIVNAPCITCLYENICDISNEKINPTNCKLIENWVNDELVYEKDKILKSDNHIETLVEAEFWCSKSGRFDIIGKVERNNIKNSPNKFVFLDKLNKKMPLILKLSNEKNEMVGKNIIIKNVKLTGKAYGLVIDATLSDSLIEMV
jgi:hypothetical protein